MHGDGGLVGTAFNQYCPKATISSHNPRPVRRCPGAKTVVCCGAAHYGSASGHPLFLSGSTCNCILFWLPIFSSYGVPVLEQEVGDRHYAGLLHRHDAA